MLKRLIRVLFCVGLLSSSATAAWAIKAKPGTVCASQPDGTTLTIRIHGDERFHYVTTSDGFLIQRGTDGYFRYITSDGNAHRSLTDIVAHNVNQRTSDELRFTSKQTPLRSQEAVNLYFSPSDHHPVMAPEQILQPKKITARRQQQASTTASSNESQYLVILVQYTDEKLTYTTDDFDIWLNQPGYSVDGGTGSVKDYYRDNSMGLFVPNFTVMGPYTLDHSESYYAENSSETSADCNPEEMIIEAVKKAKADHADFDFSVFDNDGDGYMDNINVIYAGYSEASTGETLDMWPHSAHLSSTSNEFDVDGITVNNYSVSAELVGASGGKMDGIGTFTHEFGHILGLKDMYDTDDYDNGLGINPGDYTIFASGSYNNDSRTPPYLMAFERMQMGWLTPTALTSAEDVTLQPISDNVARYINAQPNLDWSTDGYDLYMLENRQQTGWDTYIPAHGLLIYHYDYTTSSVTNYWSVNGPNNNASHRCLYIVPADGIDDDLTRKGDTYPGITASIEFSDETHPEAVSWTGEKLHTPITNISEDADGIVRFQAKGGTSTLSFLQTLALDDADITDTSAVVSAKVISHTSEIESMGFCWSDTNEFPTTSDSKAEVTVADNVSYTITGLTPATDYHVRAYMTLADGTTVYGTSVPATTEYAIAQAPYAYVFDHWTGAEPDGWRVIDNNGDGVTWIEDSSTGSAVYQFDYWNNADDWLISQKMHIPERGALYLVRGVTDETCVERLEIYISTRSRSISDFHLVKSLTLADNFGVQTVDEVDLSDYAGDDAYIAIVAKSDRLQNSIWLWEMLLTSRLETPSITDFSALSNGLHLEWTPIDDAKYYYLDFYEVTDEPYTNTVFLPESDIASVTGDVETGTGSFKFISSGSIETIEYPDSITDVKYLLLSSGPRGSSTLSVEGSCDGTTWERIGELQQITSNDADGTAIELTSYLEDKYYKRLRISCENNGRLVIIHNFTVTYRDGFVWNSLAAGRVDNSYIDIDETSPGEFFTGKKYAAEVYAGDGLLFYDASEPAFYQYDPTGITAPDMMGKNVTDRANSTRRFVASNGIVSLTGLTVGQQINLYSAEGLLLRSLVPTSSSVAISLNGYNGIVICKPLRGK